MVLLPPDEEGRVRLTKEECFAEIVPSQVPSQVLQKLVCKTTLK